MALLDDLLHDLSDESASLDSLVAGLDEDGWDIVTPAVPWTIADTVGHLLWTDRVAVVAATDPARFTTAAVDLLAGAGATADADDAVTALATEAAAMPMAQLLDTWRRGRERLADALRAMPAGDRLPWFGPPMAPASMATARLMETWAHGHDVAAALGVERVATARLRHVAHIAVRARGFAFAVHDRPIPTEDVRVVLTAPDGERWSWGDEEVEQRVTGSASDFCLLAVQRVHRDDTDVVAEGSIADEWLDVVQAFAGAPGSKRAPMTDGGGMR